MIPQAHLRSLIVLLFLLSILYGGFQMVMVVQSKKKVILRKKMKTANSKMTTKHKAFDEGEDRPIPASMRGKRKGGDPTTTAK
jgi:hypothetical protein